mmetsp:Transcript_110933/g.357856  ORF Transcript_110933/g.357856 Transcript_110933/m.357856 type:complete len:373 (-) Transcript_110933:17-1135(-)
MGTPSQEKTNSNKREYAANLAISTEALATIPQGSSRRRHAWICHPGARRRGDLNLFVLTAAHINMCMAECKDAKSMFRAWTGSSIAALRLKALGLVAGYHDAPAPTTAENLLETFQEGAEFHVKSRDVCGRGRRCLLHQASDVPLQHILAHVCPLLVLLAGLHQVLARTLVPALVNAALFFFHVQRSDRDFVAHLAADARVRVPNLLLPPALAHVVTAPRVAALVPTEPIAAPRELPLLVGHAISVRTALGLLVGALPVLPALEALDASRPNQHLPSSHFWANHPCTLRSLRTDCLVPCPRSSRWGRRPLRRCSCRHSSQRQCRRCSRRHSSQRPCRRCSLRPRRETPQRAPRKQHGASPSLLGSPQTTHNR